MATGIAAKESWDSAFSFPGPSFQRHHGLSRLTNINPLCCFGPGYQTAQAGLESLILLLLLSECWD